MDPKKKRYHVDVTFMYSPLQLGLLDIFQISDLACYSDYECLEHKQLCCEISYIVSGEGIFTRNGKEYKVTPKMLFLVSKNDMHYIRSSKSNPIRYICLGFNFNESHPDYNKFVDICSFFENLKDPIATDLYDIYSPLSLAISEISTPQFLSMELFKTYVIQVIISTYRSFHNQPYIRYSNIVPNSNVNPLVYEITNYIDTNLTKIDKLTDISQSLGYSYGYLSKVFSKTMDTTIKGYYTQRRFEKAAEMLNDEFSIAAISEKLNFADVQSFCKAFKQFYNVPPGEYRSFIKNKK